MTDQPDDHISLEEQIDLIVESIFTPEGPHYNEVVKGLLDEVMHKQIDHANGREQVNVARLVFCGGAINSAMVGLLDDFGVEAVGILLQAMSDRYMEYVEKAESLH